MLQEHVPDWIRATEAWKWLCGPGVKYVPLWNHAWSLATEVAVWMVLRGIEARLVTRSDRAGRTGALPKVSELKGHLIQPDRRGCATVLFAGLFLAHGCFAFLLSAVLDGGVRFFYWSAIWAWVAIFLGVAVLVINRRVAPFDRAERGKGGSTVIRG